MQGRIHDAFTYQTRMQGETQNVIHKTSVSRKIKETTNVNWDVLMEAGYLKVPQNENDWREVAEELEVK